MNYRKLMPIVWAPFLGACMMGGMAHTSRMGGPGSVDADGAVGPLHYAEASSGGVTIALSLPAPTMVGAVGMEARLTGVDGPESAIDGEVRLRVRTPGGAVDELPMRSLHSTAGVTYRAVYDFRTPGSYLVTADGWTGAEEGANAASVTTRVDVVDESRWDRHDWTMPMAVLGGIGMLAMMAVMMSN